MTGILTLNTGSSSLKFGLYRAAEEPEMLVHGQVDGIAAASARLVLYEGERKSEQPVNAATQPEAMSAVLTALQPHLETLEISGIGHRIVHGGPQFAEAAELTPNVIETLTAYATLAPLHQPQNLAGVAMAREAFPGAVQIGCFDTAFHRSHPWVNDTFALPRRFYDKGIRRYGFHGLSYDYITGVIAKDYPELQHGRIVIAHLGNGASMCAVNDGQSIGSTMGFSALDGLPMGTRCGQIDPGVVLHLISQEGLSPDEVTDLLYKGSGLLGLSGVSSDMRSLLASDLPEAAEAIDYYVFRARREIGAMTAVLGGIDGLIFCGGIGENATVIRKRIVEGLDYLGLTLNEEANARNDSDIGRGAARMMVIPTDEERIIARAVQKQLGKRQAACSPESALPGRAEETPSLRQVIP